MPVLPTSGVGFDGAQLSRRGFIAAGIAGGLTLAGCTNSTPLAPGAAAQMAAAINAAEAARLHSGRTVTASLTPQVTQIDLGGPIVRTMAFGDTIPGPVIRAKVGDELVVNVSNRLGEPTSAHWHGIALRNDMDGSEPATPNIDAGQDFTYKFSVPNSGTYWVHPHVGLQDDVGLYLPLIVEDPTEGNYDAEWIVVLDDWTNGVGKSPQQLYDELTNPNKPPMPMPAETSTTSDITDHLDEPDHLDEGYQLDESYQLGQSDPRSARGAGRTCRHQRPAWRRRRRHRLPVLSDQRPNSRGSHDLRGKPGSAHPDPFHQLRHRHRISRRAGRTFDDGHSHRWLPGGAHPGRRPADRYG